MWRSIASFLACAATAAAAGTAQVIVVSNNNGDVQNTTVNVPIGSETTPLQFFDASKLILKSASSGVDVAKINCTAFWLDQAGGSNGKNIPTSFNATHEAIRPENSMGMFVLMCANSAVSRRDEIKALITVVNDDTYYGGHIWNTIVEVPIPGQSSELSLPDAASFSLTGAVGIADISAISCIPTWVGTMENEAGDSFSVGQQVLVPEGNIGLHLIECQINNTSTRSLSAAVARGDDGNKALVTVVNDRTKYNGDIWNTTVEVPTPGQSSELSLPNAVSLSLTGAVGTADISTISCIPTWLGDLGEVPGEIFFAGEQVLAPNYSIGLHRLNCITFATSPRGFSDMRTHERAAPIRYEPHETPSEDCFSHALTPVGEPYPCHCFSAGEAYQNLATDQHAHDAIEAACRYFSNGTIQDDTDWKFWHQSDPPVNEYVEGPGVVMLHIWWHGMDTEYCGPTRDNETAWNDFDRKFEDACRDSFWGLFDNAATVSADVRDDKFGCGASDVTVLGHQLHGGKGGWGTDRCLGWEIDAAPSVNNPDA